MLVFGDNNAVEREARSFLYIAGNIKVGREPRHYAVGSFKAALVFPCKAFIYGVVFVAQKSVRSHIGVFGSDGSDVGFPRTNTTLYDYRRSGVGRGSACPAGGLRIIFDSLADVVRKS